jgi:hypothetical protein
MSIYCGIDWSEHHCEVAIVEDAGVGLTVQRTSDDAAGLSVLLDRKAVRRPSPWRLGSSDLGRMRVTRIVHCSDTLAGDDRGPHLH